MTSVANGDQSLVPPPPAAQTPDGEAPPVPVASKTVYLVSYDLHAAHHDRDYALVEARLRSLGRSVRILHAQFLVQSERSAHDVAEYVAQVLGAEDHLFVTAVTDDMAWRRLGMGDERAARWRHAARRR